MQQRYADKEAVRMGHILRCACTPEQIYMAEHTARAEHPEAWEGRFRSAGGRGDNRANSFVTTRSARQSATRM